MTRGVLLESVPADDNVSRTSSVSKVEAGQPPKPDDDDVVGSAAPKVIASHPEKGLATRDEIRPSSLDVGKSSVGRVEAAEKAGQTRDVSVVPKAGDEEEAEVEPLRMCWVYWSVFARLVAVPLVNMWITLALWKVDWMFPPSFKDEVVLFLLLVEPAQPCAMALGLQAQLCKHGIQTVAVVTFWQYLCAIITLTAAVTWYLGIVL